MKNLKEFEALIERYESITLGEIEGVEHEFSTIRPLGLQKAMHLTGFGHVHTCSLCESAGMCLECVYKVKTGHLCGGADSENTYGMIYYAATNKELLEAFKARAKHMRNILKD